MSRTFRRNNKHLLNRHVGSFDDFQQYKDYWQRRYPELSIEQIYQRRIHRFTRDRHSGIFSAPRWFRHERFNARERRYERHQIHQCLRTDEWDDHLTGQSVTGARGLWSWLMS